MADEVTSNDRSMVVSNKDDKLNRFLDKKAAEASRSKSQRKSKWKEYERFYDGDQWKTGVRRTVTNIIFPTIESITADITEVQPGADVIASDSEKQAEAELLDAATQYVFEDQNLMMHLVNLVRQSNISTTQYLYVSNDPDKENGEGTIVLKRFGWREVDIDPAANSVDNASYVRIIIPSRVEELRRKFPKHAEEIKPFRFDSDAMDMGFSVNDRDPNRDTAFDPKQNDFDRYDLDNIAFMEEWWVKDYEMIKIPEEETIGELEREREELLNGITPDIGKFEDHKAHAVDHFDLKKEIVGNALGLDPESVDLEDKELISILSNEIAIQLQIIDDHIEAHQLLFEENPNAERPKYKNSLKQIIRIGKVIVHNGEPDIKDGLIPLAEVHANIRDDSPYSDGEVKNIISNQKVYNTLDWFEFEALLLNANPGWIIDNNSGVVKGKLSNKNGIIIRKRQGTEVRRLDPGVISPQLSERKATEKFMIEFTSGQSDASRGITTKGNPSGITVARLQEAAGKRNRLKTRQLLMFTLPKLVRLIIPRILKYWPPEKMLRTYDADGQIKYVKFDREFLKNVNYEVKGRPGTTNQLTKDEIANTMKELVLGGFLPIQMLIRHLDLNNKAEILQELENRDELKQAVQLLSQENEALKAQLQLPGVGNSQVNPQAAVV